MVSEFLDESDAVSVKSESALQDGESDDIESLGDADLADKGHESVATIAVSRWG